MLAELFESRAVKGGILADEIIRLRYSRIARRNRALFVVDGMWF